MPKGKSVKGKYALEFSVSTYQSARVADTWHVSVRPWLSNGESMSTYDPAYNLHLTGQMDTENSPKCGVYALKWSMEPKVGRVNEVLRLMAGITRRMEKSEMPVVTFGQYVYKLAKAMNVEEIWIRHSDRSHEWDYNDYRNNFSRYTLTNGARQIDTMLLNTFEGCSNTFSVW